MKKAILASLFSATLLVGSFGTTVFADELIPTDPSTPTVEVPTDPSTPPVEVPTDPSEATPPVDPVEPPVTPTEPTEPTVPTDPSEPEKPVAPTEPTTPVEPTEPSKPVEPEKPVTPSKPTEPEQPAEPTQPSKPVEVVVTPDGEINHDGNTTQLPKVPIETSNVNEITHIPTLNTPITTISGEAIIAVKDGVPMTQTNEGLQPIQTEYKVLPSGNVAVKGDDGKVKVLPKTGEKETALLSAVGGVLSMVSGLIILKKRQFETEK